MKIVNQSTFWNKKSIVEELASYKAPNYWKSFLCTLKDPQSRKVLDIGCGGGRNSALAASLGFDIYACDAHIGMVRKTRSVLSSYFPSTKKILHRVRRANFAQLPYAPRSFDIIIASGVFHNTNTYKKFESGIREASRILKTSGNMCLNIFYLGRPDLTMTQSKKDPTVFYTNLGLPMVLLPMKSILDVLKRHKLIPRGKIHTYVSDVNTGKRFVLRGVFKKTA